MGAVVKSSRYPVAYEDKILRHENGPHALSIGRNYSFVDFTTLLRPDLCFILKVVSLNISQSPPKNTLLSLSLYH